MTAVFIAIVVVLVATIAWRTAQRDRVETRTRARLPLGASGVVAGGEPLDLRAPNATVGIVLLHGFGDTPQAVSSLARALHERGYDVSAPLLPGHGRTLPAFAASTNGEWLQAAREAHAAAHQRHDRVVLIGLSLGGALAATVAADDPALSALVLLAPYLDAPPWLRTLTYGAGAISMVMPYVGGDPVRSIQDPAARAAALGYGATTPGLVRELIAAADRARAALPRIGAPTLYIQSREDNRITVAVAERAFAMIGAVRKRLDLLTGCGHVITVDFCHGEVTAKVLAWLDAEGIP